MAAKYFQGDSVAGPVHASTAKTFAEVVAAMQRGSTLPITRKVFFSFGKRKRDAVKEVPFFVPAVFKTPQSKRNYGEATVCNLIFLDIDDLPDGLPDADTLKAALAPFNFLAYTTASSTPEKPRMRVVVDASNIPLHLYAKAVATIGKLLGLSNVTSESKVAVQPMFLPTRFADSPKGETPVFAVNLDGRPFTTTDIANLPESQGQSPNGKNGNGAHPHEPSEDDLENCVAPNPDFTLDMARSALNTLDPDLPRPKWTLVAAAMRHQFFPKQNEEAFELFDEWSKEGQKYQGEEHTRYIWNSFKQTPKGRAPVTIGTLVKMAEEEGWQDPRKPAKPAKDALGYYDSAKKEFLIKNEGGRWLSHGTDGFKRYLRKVGFSTKIPEGKPLSPAEEVMEAAINQRDVRYAGPLAGRAAGFYTEGGVRFLVTESPTLVEPVKGDCSIICGLLSGLVGHGEHGPTQLAIATGWLKMSFESQRAGKRQPGQALALAGPIGCGKSLLQGTITELLGGRSAKVWRYMSGRTDFNFDWFGAEHLMLEDEQSSTDIRARSNLAAHIKAIAVNELHSCHKKHGDAVNLRPFWRLSISLNDEPEAMLVLPPMRADLADKIILLQCTMPTTPFPTGSPELRAAYWKKIQSEIPAFAQYLLDYEIPEHLHDTRFGVRYFHHPELLEGLRSLAPETKLLELIDRCIFSERKTAWEGTAGDLENLLRSQYSGVHEEAGRLFHWNTACGVYLGKLEGKGRVQHKRHSQKRLWVIQPPSEIDLDTF